MQLFDFCLLDNNRSFSMLDARHHHTLLKTKHNFHVVAVLSAIFIVASLLRSIPSDVESVVYVIGYIRLKSKICYFAHFPVVGRLLNRGLHVLIWVRQSILLTCIFSFVLASL